MDKFMLFNSYRTINILDFLLGEFWYFLSFEELVRFIYFAKLLDQVLFIVIPYSVKVCRECCQTITFISYIHNLCFLSLFSLSACQKVYQFYQSFQITTFLIH